VRFLKQFGWSRNCGSARTRRVWARL